MPKRSGKDINETAFSVVQQSVSKQDTIPATKPEKNPAAVALGRLGGIKGGKARALSLSAKKRREIAQKAAESRWKRSEIR
jgi:hypothetical protein